uniref:ARAD1A09746p n=1 Tax=Blastobotrys adeninivorans TaxID=409370 RepID=A0A060SY56_BLAAD
MDPEKVEIIHDEGPLGDAKLASTLDDTKVQIEAEHQLGLFQGIKEYRKAVFWSFIVSMCVVMDGYDNALIGSLYAFPEFNKTFGSPVGDGYELSANWQTALSSMAGVGGIIGIMISGQLTERYGHRKVMLGALTFICGAVFAYFFGSTKGALIAGGILCGIPIGMFSTIAPTYASEVCPVVLRGYMTTYVNMCWVIGQLISQGVLRGCLGIDNKWAYKIPFAVQWAWPVPLMVLIYLAPESPWWLVRADKPERAVRMVKRLSNQTDEEAHRTVAMMVHTTELEKKVQAGATYLDCFKGTDLRRTEVSCITFLIQSMSVGNVMGYSSYFFTSAGLSTDNAYNMSIGQYCMGIAGVVCSWFLITHIGRRHIYMWGVFGVGLLFLIMGFVSLAPSTNSSASWATASILLVIVFLYDMTVGPVCYAIISEMSSTRLRSKTISLSRNLYNVYNIVNGIIYPYMLNSSAGNWKGKVGFLQFGLCMVGFAWAFFRLPEAKGRTYEELDVMFMKRLPARKFSGYVVDLDEEHEQFDVKA